MTFSTGQLYLTWGGQIGASGSGSDIWQCGLHLADFTPSGSPPMPSSGDLEDLWAIVRDYHVNAGQTISSGAAIHWLKAALLDQDGEYTEAPVIVEHGPYGGAVTSTQSASPQDALAVTLWSGSTFGKANYGRFYLPWFCGTVATGTGRLDDVSTVLANSLGLIQDVNAWAAAYASPADVAVANMSQVGTGTTKRVTHVRIGNVKDTQRRRRNRIGEVVQTAAL
jgi:hypothetical protein